MVKKSIIRVSAECVGVKQVCRCDASVSVCRKCVGVSQVCRCVASVSV